MAEVGNPWGFYVLWSVIVIVIGFVIVYSYKISKEHPEKPRPIDPIVKAILISSFIFFLMFSYQLFGGEQAKNFLAENYWWLFIIFPSLLIIYMWVVRKKGPMPYPKLKRIALEIAKSECQGEVETVKTTFFPMKKFMVTKEGKEGDIYSDVANWLFDLMTPGGMKNIWIKQNIYTGYPVDIQVEPPLILVNKLLSEKAALQKDEILEAFGETESEEQKED